MLYGEWLRRKRRRGEAREQLRAAYEMLDAIGIGAFAERARRELRATGETARQRTIELTAQEAQVAGLAREGLSNPEIGARLFISTRMVQYHLGKVFTKLDQLVQPALSRPGRRRGHHPAALPCRRSAPATRPEPLASRPGATVCLQKSGLAV